MRLRYLRIADVPPLGELALEFRREPVFRPAYGIHFVVGVNGSGKTRLLRALTDVFLGLEVGRPPGFPVTLVYELGRRETGRGIVTGERLCWIYHPGGAPSAARYAVFDVSKLSGVDVDGVSWSAFTSPPVTLAGWSAAVLRDGALVQLGSGGELEQLLPAAMVVYTSGAIGTWEEVFAGTGIDAGVQAGLEVDAVDERPAGWTRAREARLAAGGAPSDEPPTSGAAPAADPPTGPALRAPTRATLLASDRLPLALWAVLLEQAAAPTAASDRARRSLAAALGRVGWEGAVTLGLRLRLEPEVVAGLSGGERAVLRRLYRAATFARREPEPGTGRLLAFDLAAPISMIPSDPAAQGAPPFTGSTTAQALLWTFGESARPFDIFRTLHDWSRRGLVEGVTLALAKEGTEGLLTLEDLSDGERMYLGRLSVLHLLRGTDDALVVLDEPETHFNDAWKREIVDVIDGVMRSRASEVLVSTHSSIALTDAFDAEVVLVERIAGAGRVQVVRTPVNTFGASPTEIMRHLFGASNVAGERAAEHLDLLLMVADHPRLAESFWRDDAEGRAEQAERTLARLAARMRSLAHDYGDEAERRDTLRSLLRALQAYARTVRGTSRPRLRDVLLAMRERVGSGYYQFELIRRAGPDERGREQRRSRAAPA